MWCTVTVTSFVNTEIIVNVPGLLIFYGCFIWTALYQPYCPFVIAGVLKMPAYGLGSWRKWNSCYVHALFAIEWTSVTVPSSKAVGTWSFRPTSVYCLCLWYVEIYITGHVKAYFPRRLPKLWAGSEMTDCQRSSGVDGMIVRREWREIWSSYTKNDCIRQGGGGHIPMFRWDFYGSPAI
jgi:hypothetical protein